MNYGTEVSDEVYTRVVGGGFEVSFQRTVSWSGKKRLKIKSKQLDTSRLFLKNQKSLQSLTVRDLYKDLETATLAIRKAGATYIVTNIDSNLPGEKGPIPGSSAITGFLKVATQVEPIIIGKNQAAWLWVGIGLFKR